MVRSASSRVSIDEDVHPILRDAAKRRSSEGENVSLSPGEFLWAAGAKFFV
jgi:hypothetical protein